MTPFRIRARILTALCALALLLIMTGPASADPGDGGIVKGRTPIEAVMSADPGDGGIVR